MNASEIVRPSRLDIATKLGKDIPDGWWLVVYLDACEAVASYKAGKAGDPGRAKGGPDYEPGRALEESIRRARAHVRRYCASNRLDRLGTLTYRGTGCHDERLLRADLGRFFKELRRRLDGRNLPYVWSAEWHPSGHGLHAHFAVGQYVEKGLIEQSWRNGFVDIKRLDAEFSHASPVARSRIAASYLAKYVSKAFRRADGLHRYEVAQGFAPKVRRFWALSRDEALEFCGVLMGEAACRVSMSAEWEGWKGPPTMWIQWDG